MTSLVGTSLSTWLKSIGACHNAQMWIEHCEKLNNLTLKGVWDTCPNESWLDWLVRSLEDSELNSLSCEANRKAEAAWQGIYRVMVGMFNFDGRSTIAYAAEVAKYREVMEPHWDKIESLLIRKINGRANEEVGSSTQVG
jgi:hypothetical protein